MNEIKIHPSDTVAVVRETGHKVALTDIAQGENVIKYGFPIGHATAPIKKGDQVHVHNLSTNLREKLTYEYHKKEYEVDEKNSFLAKKTFPGFLRENGEVGIRNDIFIINTVGCVNEVARTLSRRTGAFCFPHPYGCSQLSKDQEVTEQILTGLVKHPNAGGVLVLGLGCENNNITRFRRLLTDVDERRIRFLNTQDCEDEIAEGERLIKELSEYADTFHRVQVPISKLKVGLKCGGSDGFSGITANPLIGQFTECLTQAGGTAVLTEVPEMFGAETLLMDRCVNKEVFLKLTGMINGFKDYFTEHKQVIYENPSPGNKAGGISTLEEKSLGCIQKGGRAPVVDVLNYGDIASKPGLNLLNGPGNDMVAITNLTAVGCQLILFSTGRGTPLGAPVPTIKISTNSGLALRKKNWIDFDAGPMLQGENLLPVFSDFILSVAAGEETLNEKNNYREIAIFKDGVTL